MAKNLTILSHNPDGLWWGSEGSKQSNGKQGRMDVELPFVEGLHGKIDIICIQESHLQDIHLEGMPQKLYGFNWKHGTASTQDKAAGVSIGYRHWMPDPINLLDLFKAEYGEAHFVQEFKELHLLEGRLMVMVFQLQDKHIIIANFYGYPTDKRSTGESGGTAADGFNLIYNATRMVEYLTKLWTNKQSVKGADTAVIFAGDFNAASYAIEIENWNLQARVGKKPTQSRSDTRNRSRAMEGVYEHFLHAKDVYKGKKQTPEPYITNRAYKSGDINYQHGIDHMFLLNELDGEKYWTPEGGTFWHGVRETTDARPESCHDLLLLKLENVWMPAINRNAKGVKSPYKKIPKLIYDNPDAMQGINNLARTCVEEMKKKPTKVGTLFNALLENKIPKYVEKFKRKIQKKVAWMEHNKIPSELEELAELRSKLHPQNETQPAFNEGCVAGIRVNDITYTDPIMIKEKVHQLFDEKFAKKETGLTPLIEKQQKDDWLKYAPPKMEQETADQLENCLTVENVTSTINEMKKDAAPGIDGQSLALYTHEKTTKSMVEILVLVSEYAIAYGRLPSSMCCSVIRLIQKGGKDNVDIASGKRPVTLMQISARIIAKVITNALRGQMSKWTMEHQRAYIPGRRIEVNTAIIAILLKKCLDNKEDDEDFIQELEKLIRVETDFKAAFDTVSHQFLRQLLHKIGMGPKMIKMIMLLVGTMGAKVIINDSLTEKFNLRVGVPQGCSLSGLLFILVLECLFRKALSQPLRYGNGVPIVKNSLEKTLYSAFADDTDIWVTEPKHVSNWFSLLGEFQKVSGLSLQMAKCKANLIGNAYSPELRTQSVEKEIKEMKVSLPKVQIGYRIDIKSVGISFTMKNYEREMNLTETTWNQKLKRISPYINVVAKKDVNASLIAKARSINANLSRLWYIVMNCMPRPEDIIATNALINKQLWNKNSYVVKREVYTRPVTEESGLNAPDAERRIDAILTMWTTLFAKGKLPTSLQEYMEKICLKIGKDLERHAKGGRKFEGQSSNTLWENLQKLASLMKSLQEEKMLSRLLIQQEKKHYAPMARSICNIAQLIAMDKIGNWDEVAMLSVKKIYQLRAKSEVKTAASNSAMEPTTGRTKWTKDGVEGEGQWKYIKDLAWRCVKTGELDLHDGLYKFVTRKLVTPTSIPVDKASLIKRKTVQIPQPRSKESQAKQMTYVYEVCPHCDVKWSTMHAMTECKDVAKVWRKVLGKEVVQASDILNLDHLGNPEERYYTAPKTGTGKKVKRKPVLTSTEIRVLSTMKEITIAVEYRAKATSANTSATSGDPLAVPVWSPKDIEHWTTVIDKRTRSAQSRKEAKLATREDNLTSEEGGIG